MLRQRQRQCYFEQTFFIHCPGVSILLEQVNVNCVTRKDSSRVYGS